MPCSNCMGKMPEDKFKTIDAFKFNCICMYSDFSFFAEEIKDDGVFLITLDEFKKHYSLVVNHHATINEKDHLCAFFFDLYSPVEEECLVIEEQIGKPIDDFGDHMSLHKSKSGVSFFSNTTSKRINQNNWEGFAEHLIWIKKEDTPLIFDEEKVIVVDTYGEQLDVYLRKMYKTKLLALFEGTLGHLKVNDHYVSPAEWYLCFQGEDAIDVLFDKCIELSIKTIDPESINIKITYDNIDKLSISHDGIFSFVDGEVCTKFSFTDEYSDDLTGVTSNSYQGFCQKLAEADILKVDIRETDSYYWVPADRVKNENGKVIINSPENKGDMTTITLNDEYQFTQDDDEWHVTKDGKKIDVIFSKLTHDNDLRLAFG